MKLLYQLIIDSKLKKPDQNLTFDPAPISFTLKILHLNYSVALNQPRLLKNAYMSFKKNTP